MKRRTLLGLSAALVAAWPFRTFSLGAQSPRLSPGQLALLQEVATVVLPSTLTAAQVTAVAGDFQRWLGAYRSGAEVSHGYGLPRARVTPVITAEAYARQLQAIERAAAAAGGPFARLPAAAKRSVVEAALAAEKLTDLPSTPNGKHVVVDLMAFYFGGSDANDRAYGAKIGRETCRGLAGSQNEPAKVTEG
jgi:hypothetical protein